MVVTIVSQVVVSLYTATTDCKFWLNFNLIIESIIVTVFFQLTVFPPVKGYRQLNEYDFYSLYTRDLVVILVRCNFCYCRSAISNRQI